MKTVKEITIGGDGAKAGLYADATDISISVKYPIAKISGPLADLCDKGIDFIEKVIPYDQKAIATVLKTNVRAGLEKAFTALLPGVEVAEVEQLADGSAQV